MKDERREGTPKNLIPEILSATAYWLNEFIAVM